MHKERRVSWITAALAGSWLYMPELNYWISYFPVTERAMPEVLSHVIRFILQTPSLLSFFSILFLHSIYNPAANIAAPPKSAPISTTPVGIAFTNPPTPALLELVVNGLVGVCVNVVLCTTPLVNGTSVAELAPLNATLVVLGFGVAAVLFGFRTPSITCTTPFATRTSGTMTRAEFT